MTFKNLAAAFQGQVYRLESRDWMASRRGNSWAWTTWSQAGRTVERVGRALLTIGVQPGDRIGIFSDNRPEWGLADLAAISIGAVTVPLPTDAFNDNLRFILRHSAPTVVFVSDPGRMDRIAQCADGLGGFRAVVSFDESDRLSPPETVFSWPSFETKGEATPAARFYERLGSVPEDGVASVLYETAADGGPRGVMLTHRNVLSACEGLLAVLPLGEKDLSRSILPLSHGFERTAGFFSCLLRGASIAYDRPGISLIAAGAEAAPTVIFSKPGHVRDAVGEIRRGMEGHPRWRKRWFEKALVEPAKTSLLHASVEKLNDRLFFEKIRASLGGRLRMIVCDGAPDAADAALLRRTGIDVRHVWGRGELGSAVSLAPMARENGNAPGNVLPGMDVKIAQDGEILVRGPSVMKGYFGDHASTEQAMDPDGFFRTGEFGELDPQGRLLRSNGKRLA